MVAEPELFYRDALSLMLKSRVPFLLGGAFAFTRYTGIKRDTKDLDIFVRPADLEEALSAFVKAGYRTEVTAPHWLAKAFAGDLYVDLIHSSGNGLCTVDEDWFRYSTVGRVFDREVRVCPPEEMIWSKGYIMERERFDGADIAHLIWACGPRMDWVRLLRRFGHHWRVLMSHLVMYGFIFPDARDRVPDWVIERLIELLRVESHSPLSMQKVCQGTLVSRQQYGYDLQEHGYDDARIAPRGSLSEQAVRELNAALAQELRKANHRK